MATPTRHLPDASVAIPTRNRADSLARTLSALQASELADGLRVDVIVVDNGSTDHTAEVVGRAAAESPFPIHYHYEAAPGISHARNRALAVLEAPLVLFTDDDCLPATDWITRMLELFRAQPTLALVGGRVVLHNPLDSPAFTTHTETHFEFAHGSDYLTHTLMGANMAARASALQSVGAFDTALGAGSRCNVAGEDFDMVYRLVQAGCHVAFDPAPVVAHDHGRRLKDDVARTLGQAHAGVGAVLAKHAYGDRKLIHCGYWTMRQMARQGQWRHVYYLCRGALSRLRA